MGEYNRKQVNDGDVNAFFVCIFFSPCMFAAHR